MVNVYSLKLPPSRQALLGMARLRQCLDRWRQQPKGTSNAAISCNCHDTFKINYVSSDATGEIQT